MIPFDAKISEQQDTSENNQLIYVSNAGVLLNLNGRKILIDGLCREGFDLYRTTPDKMAEDILLGIPPYDGIDLMLFTHHHGDHFDAELVAAYVRNGGKAAILSTEKTVAAVRKQLGSARQDQCAAAVSRSSLEEKRGVSALPFEGEGQLISLDLAPGERHTLHLSGIEIDAISMVHLGKEYENVRNLAFLIKGNVKILHVGDGAYEVENYQGLKLDEEGIDLMIAPFPYVSLPSSRNLIQEWISPKKIAVMHLPQKEKDEYGWTESVKKSAKRADQSFPPIRFLEELGEDTAIE
ncbi:MBL fold metallo-hydrolase [Anoxybacterium hadale]|uniref:MBL fold metallo-hydrolase n=1 Tax=Anoxybacterium hadale TaxID=3408580 RepID=UPI003AFF7027